ncbi:peptidyl-prolyl cis-trans isomerase [bacterium]|nr:peptidyl-prolyl cis-trans isomerase [bacterium]
MINRVLLMAAFVLLSVGCTPSEQSDVIAEVGSRRLTRAEFEFWAEKPYEKASEAERIAVVSEWVDLSMLEQAAEAAGLLDDPVVQQRSRKMLANYYRATLLAREPQPEINDSLITAYYKEHEGEFKRPSDSYLIEGFWCESEDSLKVFRRALEKADTSQLRSGFVIWEGKWLAETSELEDNLLAALRWLPPGSLTPVLPMGDGYRLVRLHEVYPKGTQLSLDAVRLEIREQLLVEQSQRRQERWLTELRSRYQPRLAKVTQSQ